MYARLGVFPAYVHPLYFCWLSPNTACSISVDENSVKLIPICFALCTSFAFNSGVIVKVTGTRPFLEKRFRIRECLVAILKAGIA